MLVAMDKDGKKTILTPQLQRPMLLQLREKVDFYCPVCRSKLYLKVGTKKIPHFAHEKESICSANEGESSTHMEGKLKLFSWIKHQAKRVELEKFIDEINQRADVYFQIYENKVVLEFQCSSIPKPLFLKRTYGYHQKEIHVLWIFGSNQFKRMGAVSLKVNSFLSLGSIYTPQGYILLFYCNEQDVFIQLSPLLSFSPYLVYSHIHLLPRATTSFNDLFTCRMTNIPFLVSQWNKKKRKYRLFAHEYFYPQYLSYINLLRTYHLPPGCFPSEAGIPLRNGYLFETPVIIWQTNVLMEFFYPLEVGARFTLIQLKTYMRSKFKKGELMVRTMPLVNEKVLFEKVLEEYLFFLCEVGIVKIREKGMYEKCRQLALPKDIEEGIKGDEVYCDIIEKGLRKGIQ